jgi:hypothetical protein
MEHARLTVPDGQANVSALAVSSPERGRLDNHAVRL